MLGLPLGYWVAFGVCVFVVLLFTFALCKAAANGDRIAERAWSEHERREALTRISDGGGWRK
jgi:uncharacterized membrane protein